MKITLVTAFAATAILASCGLSEKKCTKGDWAAIGKADGLRGAASDQVVKYIKSCSKHDISVDQSAWAMGRDEGLKTYCTPQSAYNQGRNGHRLKNVCPDADLDAMSAAHEKGRKYHDIVSQIDDLKRERHDLRHEISQLIGAGGTPESLARIGQLRSQILHIDLRINHLQLQKRRFDQL